MGSQWAPVMCAIVALHREHTYSLAFGSAVFSGKLAASFRYVDNCLWVDLANRGNTFASKQFWRLDFYTEPILLEDVPDFDALGFNLNLFQRTVSAQLPCNSTIRTSHTAGPLANMFAGLLARARLVVRHSYPDYICIAQLQDLLALHTTRDPTYLQCLPEFISICRQRFPHLKRDVLLHFVEKDIKCPMHSIVCILTCSLYTWHPTSNTLLEILKTNCPIVGFCVCVNC